MPLAPGEKLGPYEILSQLGEGDEGMKSSRQATKTRPPPSENKPR